MLKVGFNPTVSFRANDNYLPDNADAKDVVEKLDQIPDSYENSMQEVTENIPDVTKSKSIKEFSANVWKFFTVANQMANATLKGLFYGAVTGVSLLTGSWLFKSLPNAFKKEGPSLAQTVMHPIKNISKSGKVIAGVASAVVLGCCLVAGKLEANEKTAVIYHKLKVGHRDA